MAVLCTTARFLPAKVDSEIQILSSTTPKFGLHRSTSIYSKPKIRLKFCCRNSGDNKQTADFSLLESDPPWENGSVWSNMGLYIFSLHIPLSFGGLSVVAHLLNQPDLEPQIKAVALLVIETLELFGALLLLEFTTKHKPVSFFQIGKMRSERSWMVTAVLGFGVLVIAMFFTSFLADKLVDTKGVNNHIVKEILLSGSVSQSACALVYCIIAPLLEEIVYRRFLLTSLASSMKWQQAVMISSLIFSAAHLSSENFIQLVIVGIVLGCSYCWSGDLRSSILLHSMYNALTLVITVLA
ncbi:hypothetical protein BVRB_9g206610 [Beta vulgaris subsp. vulgaris]|uniref:uncharacterized protein LOC104903027 isoform X2 n=1 Tax=Beta vulgaris subsp. vulgaris TaxID=3555 RepID=UPI00053F9C74|nr:uncharacterized protein LOC104903027 isoform X2 [Beta vulgaris subsp. vulgaris]KMT02200.1 hypothetical protein BVRB_9g206610 [Beta vulgaris subsp. vulgaris]